MKTRNIICAVVLLTAGTMAGCRQTAAEAAHDHDESLQLTAYNHDFEVYAEVTPLVKGEASDVVAHFTWLSNFKPIEEGTVTATLTVDNEKVGQTLEAPSRQGIYKFCLTPKREGPGRITFDIKTKKGTSRLVSPAVTVYTDAHEAQHAAADKIVSESDLLQARGEYERAEAKYRNLCTNFSSGRQTATVGIGGFVKQLHVISGQYVEAGQPLVTITQNRNLQIRAEVQPRYYTVLGNIASATIKHGERTQTLEELCGRLVSYGKAVNTDSPLIPVTFEIQNKGDFLPGSFVEMFIRTKDTRPALTVPSVSIIEEMGNYFVYVQLTPEYFEKREVTIGQTDGLRTEVRSGLNGAERVVARGATLVKITQSSGGLDAESGHQH